MKKLEYIEQRNNVVCETVGNGNREMAGMRKNFCSLIFDLKGSKVPKYLRN